MCTSVGLSVSPIWRSCHKGTCPPLFNIIALILGVGAVTTGACVFLKVGALKNCTLYHGVGLEVAGAVSTVAGVFLKCGAAPTQRSSEHVLDFPEDLLDLESIKFFFEKKIRAYPNLTYLACSGNGWCVYVYKDRNGVVHTEEPEDTNTQKQLSETLRNYEQIRTQVVFKS